MGLGHISFIVLHFWNISFYKNHKKIYLRKGTTFHVHLQASSGENKIIMPTGFYSLPDIIEQDIIYE